jgi:hypothetical protein
MGKIGLAVKQVKRVVEFKKKTGFWGAKVEFE